MFGYEENGLGQVVKQKNPETVYAGDFKSSVGPGHYNSELGYSQVKVKKSPAFRMPNAERKTFLNRSNTLDLGPGTYNVTSVSQNQKKRNKPTSVFSSKVNRTAFGMHKSKASVLLRERRKLQSLDTYLNDMDS